MYNKILIISEILVYFLSAEEKPMVNRHILTALFAAFLVTACSVDAAVEDGAELIPPPIRETFDIADRPVIEHDGTEDFELLKPWNYEKSWNANRKYPLVISLHGSGGSYYKPCIVGNDDEMKRYPCFFFSPTASSWGGSGDTWVRTRIAALITDYRIDPNRIYLMGYSMGGSGSYPFASKCYSEQGVRIAGIVRLAGQSQPQLDAAIRDKCAVWYHIGLTDSEARVEIARDAYNRTKTHFGSAVTESVTPDEIESKPRTTHTLVRNGRHFFKKSEYTDVGHSPSVPFRDPAVLAWLFSQTLTNW